jgi:hypothetical protein
MRLMPWVIAAIVLLAVWRLHAARDITRAPGVLAAAEPQQRDITGAAAITRGAFTLRPRAEFDATVRILRREDYSLGALAGLAPTDFAVGWGPMSDSAVLAHIEISQVNRFYFWRTDSWPLTRAQIETHSANWHLIPASEPVRATLAALRKGSVVELHGQLVDIEGREVGMVTSLTRADTGAGACEILFASSAKIIRPGS